MLELYLESRPDSQGDSVKQQKEVAHLTYFRLKIRLSRPLCPQFEEMLSSFTNSPLQNQHACTIIPTLQYLNFYPKHIEYDFFIFRFNFFFFLPIECVFEIVFVYFCNFTQSLHTFQEVKCVCLYARTMKSWGECERWGRMGNVAASKSWQQLEHTVNSFNIIYIFRTLTPFTADSISHKKCFSYSTSFFFLFLCCLPNSVKFTCIQKSFNSSWSCWTTF